MKENLEKHLINEIKREPMRFLDFMSNALYHPTDGYYTTTEDIIGERGDFFTAPHVHSGFGQCIADQLFEMWIICESPAHFMLVELGPGTGRLALDILQYVSGNPQMESFYKSLQCILVETSEKMKALQYKNLASFREKCTWVKTIEGITIDLGVIYSNEFFDALPVHKITRSSGKLQEVYIDWSEKTGFYEVLGSLSTPDIEDYLIALGIALTEGQAVEVNLIALDWLKQAATTLGRGFLLTIDYGYTVKELKEPFRHEGTLMSYSGHKSTTEVLNNPGEQDITAHVNFSALHYYGMLWGLKTLGFTSQMRFLLNLDLQDKMKLDTTVEGIKETQALKKLVMPEEMGERFKVLIQSKKENVSKLRGLEKLFGSLKL